MDGERHEGAVTGDLAGRLTRREREVLLLVARGMTTREIAQLLHLSPHTVREYIDGGVAKLGARNRVAAAIRLALTEATTAA